MRVIRYVELDLILGMDVTILDGVNQQWILGLNVPSTAQSHVQRLKCNALEAWMPMVA